MERNLVPDGFVLVPFEKRHLEEALIIERESFSEPWGKEIFEELFFSTAPASFSLAIEAEDGQLAAYGGIQYLFDEGEVLNVAVSPAYRRRGLGRAIMRGFDDCCREKGIARLFLEVRRSNISAQGLYLGAGYREISVRKNYYTSPVEDALIMEREYPSEIE